MTTTELRVYLDNEAADETRLETFAEIEIDQAIGMAAEARLKIELAADEAGNWSDMDEDYAQPFARVRIEVRVGDDEFSPLIDGPLVGQRFELSATPNASRMTLIVQDDSVLLNREEGVEVFEDRAPHEIVEELFVRAGLQAEVDTTSVASSDFARYIVRRGTPMHLVRELARRHGMFTYVRPGDEPGTSVGVFLHPTLSAGDLPELVLMGADRNVNRLSVDLDALRPAAVRADSVRIGDKAVLSSNQTTSALDALGDEAIHDVIESGQILLARTREEQSDLDGTTAAAVAHSSWAYRARGNLSAAIYPAVLSPHAIVSIAGAGTLSGNYLVSRVTHHIDEADYRQDFVLQRNARSAASATASIGETIF